MYDNKARNGGYNFKTVRNLIKKVSIAKSKKKIKDKILDDSQVWLCLIHMK